MSLIATVLKFGERRQIGAVQRAPGDRSERLAVAVPMIRRGDCAHLLPSAEAALVHAEQSPGGAAWRWLARKKPRFAGG